MTQRKREVWLDALRIISAFLVVVNHTNSDVFQASTPAAATWWLSILWYYVSKLAVPMFVMISGACLLHRQDSFRRMLGRLGRVLGALLVFSYLYYLHDAWVNYGLWPRALRLDVLLKLVWTQQIADSFWYLYFYAGLLLAMPLLQRLCAAMKPRDMLWLMGLCFAVDGAWPLAAHYVPALHMPAYVDIPLCSGYIGLLFAGHWVRHCMADAKKYRLHALCVLVLSLAASVLLTRVEFSRVPAGEKYWFMDDRMHPSLFVMAGAISLMVLVRGLRQPSGRMQRVTAELGGCAFGVYLLQQWIIAQTEVRLFAPLCGVLPAFPAVLVWEAIVFAIALAGAWVMRRIPLLKKIV